MESHRETRGPLGLRGQSGLTLVELLITIIIAGIISSMLFATWFSLNRSYAFTVNATTARDLGRQAVARIQREVRDAEAVPGTYTQLPPLQFDLKAEPMILRSRPWTLVFTTTFNESGNASATKAPQLVCYRVYYEPETATSAEGAELWRYEDVNGDGRISNVTFYAGDEPTTNGRPDFPNTASEQSSGEGAQMVIKSITNTDSALATPVSAFTYSGYFDPGGGVLNDGTLYWRSTVIGAAQRMKIISVRTHLLIDVNPRRSPVFADLMTNSQLRNARQF